LILYIEPATLKTALEPLTVRLRLRPEVQCMLCLWHWG